VPVDDAQPDAFLAGAEVFGDGDGVDVSRGGEVLDPERVRRTLAVKAEENARGGQRGSF